MYQDNAIPGHEIDTEYDLDLPPSLPFFDPYRVAATPAMKALVGEVIQYIENFERSHGTRKRARKPRDQAVFKGIVEAVVCDLAYQHFMGRKGLRITLDKKLLARASRYTSDLLSEQLPVILKLMDRHLGFIKMDLGHHSPFGGRQTEIAPTLWLVRRIEARNMSLTDLTRREGEELVLLKGTKVTNARAELAEYDDDEFTSSARAEVKLINRYLRDADISYDLDISTTGQLIDERNRHMRRVFTRGSFGSGGRLFGGFWQSLGKQDRLSNILINGESVVSLDYQTMLASLAYSVVRETPPPGDAYITTFENPQGKAVSLHRSTVKKLFAASLFAERPLKQWPSGLQPRSGGLPVATVLAGIVKAHPALEIMMGQGIGHTLQFCESEILVDVLLSLIDKDIPALPVHDCIVVPESAVKVAEETMLRLFTFHTAATASVAIERANYEAD